MEMEMVMNEIVERLQEMEGKDKVVCVVDEAWENGRVRKEVERLYIHEMIGVNCNTQLWWGEHPGVYIVHCALYTHKTRAL